GAIDYESAPGNAYSITVAASDGIATTTQSFTIAVANVTPPTPVDCNGAVGGTVVEGAAAGTAVGITASSSDPNSGVIYSLVDDPGGRFAINATTGVVTVATGASLDYETALTHTYTITVRAADGSGAHNADQSFTIALTNAPPSTPV